MIIMIFDVKLKIPDYVKDEINIYLWKKENGKSGIATFDNIFALIGLAKINKRITEEEAEKIRELVYSLK
mgnify:FL=1